METAIYTGTTPTSTPFTFSPTNAPNLAIPLGVTRCFFVQLVGLRSAGNGAWSFFANGNSSMGGDVQNKAGVISNASGQNTIFGPSGSGTGGTWVTAYTAGGITFTYSGDTGGPSDVSIVVQSFDLPFTT